MLSHGFCQPIKKPSDLQSNLHLHLFEMLQLEISPLVLVSIVMAELHLLQGKCSFY